MKILVTNDDGIQAPGLGALVKALSQIGDVFVAAPGEEKSSTGHGITLRDPIRIEKREVWGAKEAWAVFGTPADCVKLAVKGALVECCDILVSGINNVSNLGTDVVYSGTVSAAIEGRILGIPSMAVSLVNDTEEGFAIAAAVAAKAAVELERNKRELDPDTILNVNLPAASREAIRGYKITRLGYRAYKTTVEKRADLRGNSYCWMQLENGIHDEQEPDIDFVAVENNYVSITPIRFDSTNHQIKARLKEWNWGEDISLLSEKKEGFDANSKGTGDQGL